MSASALAFPADNPINAGRKSEIRTGEEYRESIRDGRMVFMNGEKVPDVTTHPMFKPLVDIRARIYDMQHDAATAPS